MLVRFKPLDVDHIERYLRRVESIPLNRRPIWGGMDATQMFAHLRRSIELALGDYPEPDRSTWVTRLAGKIMHSPLPWPRGMKSPGYFFPETHEGEPERRMLLATMQKFVREVKENPNRTVASPLFGPLTMQQWTKFMGRHFEHHLRQFDV
ncbi:DUF1569 domain-containing protein [bacterium]|nr:DUF1569 domain-containing protein [bacterium]